MITLFVPETYMPVLLRREAVKMRKETGDSRWYAPIEKMDRSIPQVRQDSHITIPRGMVLTFGNQTIMRSCYRPFMLLTLEPMCFLLCLFCAFVLGVLYLFFGAFNLVFTHNHDFNLWQVGLSFLGILVGMLIGIGSDPL